MVKATTIIKGKIVAEEEYELNFERQKRQKKLADYQPEKGGRRCLNQGA